MSNVQNLLQHTKLIKDSYERVADATGERFNLFSILRIERDEVTTHSRFLAELLNVNGRHGVGNVFLDLFVKAYAKKHKPDLVFDTHKSKTKVEAYQGPVTKTTGGNIDILIQEQGGKGQSIVIENKIDAIEQPNQLLRYRNAFPDGELIFLTLYGHHSQQKNKVVYTRMSYEEDILNWLDACKKEVVDKPVVREALDQYIQLIKKITYQTNSQEMNKEIIKTVTATKDNFEAFQALAHSANAVKHDIIENTIKPIIQRVSDKNGLEASLNFTNDWNCFKFNSTEFKAKGVQLVFSTGTPKGWVDILHGFQSTIENNIYAKAIDDSFSAVFRRESGYPNWVTLSRFHPYATWEDFETLKKIHFEPAAFEEELDSVVKKSCELIKAL